jgi:hypothetical protein
MEPSVWTAVFSQQKSSDREAHKPQRHTSAERRKRVLSGTEPTPSKMPSQPQARGQVEEQPRSVDDSSVLGFRQTKRLFCPDKSVPRRMEHRVDSDGTSPQISVLDSQERMPFMKSYEALLLACLGFGIVASKRALASPPDAETADTSSTPSAVTDDGATPTFQSQQMQLTGTLPGGPAILYSVVPDIPFTQESWERWGLDGTWTLFLYGSGPRFVNLSIQDGQLVIQCGLSEEDYQWTFRGSESADQSLLILVDAQETGAAVLNLNRSESRKLIGAWLDIEETEDEEEESSQTAVMLLPNTIDSTPTERTGLEGVDVNVLLGSNGNSTMGLGVREDSTAHKRTVPHLGTDALVVGSLDKSLIDKVIQTNQSKFIYCYQRELAKNPSLQGRVTLNFTISKDGRVVKSSIRGSATTLDNDRVHSCMQTQIKTLRFPELKGGPKTVVMVQYPFDFSPGR